MRLTGVGKVPTNGYGPKVSEAKQPVDVFFLYPSTFFPPPSTYDPNAPASWNQTIEQAQEDPGIEAQVFSKAGVFAKAGTNIYAPFYQQAAGSYVLPALLWGNNDKISKTEAAKALARAYADIKLAFLYYINVLNPDSENGRRPFILAGHSQGSNLLLLLLEDILDDPDVGQIVRDKLVVAYVIGWSVTSDDFSKHPSLKDLGICTSFDQTRCIVTYNTQQDPGDFSMAKPFPASCASCGSAGSPPTGIVQKNAYSVNPLTWVANGPRDHSMGITGVTEPTFASASLNKGALFFKLNSVMPGYPDDTSIFCDLRPQLGPFIPLAKCPDNCPNCPGPSSCVLASPPAVTAPEWITGPIAGWNASYHESIAILARKTIRALW